ncbi:MAG: hypothetical protein PHI97_33130, partial [Desulfobulbus sp.]|nr:hypothetical protein [Desulfobulbus sp.]
RLQYSILGKKQFDHGKIIRPHSKDLLTKNLHILHLIFGPSLATAQTQNPRRSAATPAVLRWSPQPNMTQI